MVYNRSLILWSSLAVFCCFFAAHQAAAGQENAVIRMISPMQGAEVLTKHPDIQTTFTRPVDHDSLIILLDDNDITATAEITDRGFHCKVPILLTAGKHTLYIAGNSDNGPFEQEILFSSRQYSTVDEASTSNEWTVNVQAGNFHGNNSDDFTFTDIDSTLQHESMVRKGNWQLSLSAGARLLEQNTHGGSGDKDTFSAEHNDAYGPQEQISEGQAQNQGSIDPERQGLDLNTLLMRAQYETDLVTTAFEVGDLQIMASKNTFENLARNGGQLTIDLHKVYFGGFSVFGRDTFGVHDGIGIGFDNDDHLYGFSGGTRLLGEKIDLHGFYMDGGQKENSYSSWSQEQESSGDVYGFLLATDFFDGLLTSEFEYDRSNFDPNTGDEFSGNRDEAWRLQIGGRQDFYSYDITYERFGRDYDIPGNLSPKKDYSGITGTGTLQYEVHAVSVMLAGYHDNVDENPMYARTNSNSGQLDYFYSGFMEFPLGISYQHTSDQSTDEPKDSPETNLSTDTLSLNAGYAGPGPFSLDSSVSYSWQNDDSDQDADLATLSFTLSPTLTLDTVSITMSGTINQNRDMLSGARTDDYVLTLDTMGSLLNEQVSYELGGTYDHTLITDNNGDRHGFTGYSRINYRLPWLTELANPTIGLELQYNSDKPQGTSTTEDTRMFCTLSTSIPFNF
jgi:hypothetical protein